MDAMPEIEAADPEDADLRVARLERYVARLLDRICRLEHQLVRTRDDLRDDLREVDRRLREVRELAE